MENQVWLSDKQVAARYSVSRITVWRWAREQIAGFPQPRKISANCTRWHVADIEAFDAKMREAA